MATTYFVGSPDDRPVHPGGRRGRRHTSLIEARVEGRQLAGKLGRPLVVVKETRRNGVLTDRHVYESVDVPFSNREFWSGRWYRVRPGEYKMRGPDGRGKFKIRKERRQNPKTRRMRDRWVLYDAASPEKSGVEYSTYEAAKKAASRR